MNIEKNLDVSVLVPISERHDDLRLLFHLYAEQLNKMGKRFEFLFVLDGSFSEAYNQLVELKNEGHPVRIFRFARNFGESAALMEGFEKANAETILTLASYIQVEPEDLGRLFSAYDDGNNLVIARRYPRKDPLPNRVQAAIYHWIINKLTGASFKDITCGMRLIKKEIFSEFVLYGDLHRFIPIFALQKGVSIKEVNVTQRKEDTQLRLVRPGIYLRRLLDILTLFFLVKFTKKPLRFFGLIGTAMFVPGTLIIIYLGVLRILGKTVLADRPLLLLGMLFFVFGIQLFSVGLVGELILFSHAKDLKDYIVEEEIE